MIRNYNPDLKVSGPKMKLEGGHVRGVLEKIYGWEV